MDENYNHAMELLFYGFITGKSFGTELEKEREIEFLKLNNICAETDDKEEELCEALANFQYIALKSGFYSGFLAAKELGLGGKDDGEG